MLREGGFAVKDFEVIEQARNGDFSMLEKWMDVHGQKIERFSFQYGLSLERAGNVAEETLRSFQDELEAITDDDQVLPLLYKIAIGKLSIQLLSPKIEEVFLFDEDKELHSELVKLDEIYRVPLILKLFHGLTVEQISVILDTLNSDVIERIQTAKNIIGEPSEILLEKQLGLLGKSYDRVPITFQAKYVIRKTIQPEVKEKKERKKSKGRILIVASVFLIGILSAFFLLPKKENELTASGSSLNDFEARYQEERDMRQEVLKLDDNTYSRLNFIKAADDRMDTLKSIAHEDLEAEVEKIIHSIRLPAEMVEDIVKTPLNQDEEASIEFLSLYRDKVNDLIAAYNRILWDYRGVY